MDWRSAFLAQAASDYQTAQLLKSSPGVPLCHTLHYLQMSLEKFAKGVMTPPGSATAPSHSHEGATRLVRFLSTRSPFSMPFHRELGMSHSQRLAYLNGLMPQIQFLEQIAPSLATRAGTDVNAEYPWIMPPHDGSPAAVVAPVDYDFTAHLSPTKLEKLLQLLGVFVRSYSP